MWKRKIRDLSQTVGASVLTLAAGWVFHDAINSAAGSVDWYAGSVAILLAAIGLTLSGISFERLNRWSFCIDRQGGL